MFCHKIWIKLKNVPALLATVIKCKVELGNINHSPEYIVKYLECLDRVLIDETVDWLKLQEDNTVSVTLDIGMDKNTILGFVQHFSILLLCLFPI